MPSAKDVLPDAGEMAHAAAKTADEAVAAQSAVIEQAMRLPQELTRFYAHRMSRDLDTLQAFSRCRNPVDLVNVWTDAAQAAAEDYRDEVARMMDLVTSGAGVAVNGANGSGRSRKR